MGHVDQRQLDMLTGAELDRRAEKRVTIPTDMLTTVVAYHWRATDIDVVVKFKPALTGGYDVIELWTIHPMLGSWDPAPREIWHAVGEHLKAGGEIKQAMDKARSEQLLLVGAFL